MKILLYIYNYGKYLGKEIYFFNKAIKKCKTFINTSGNIETGEIVTTDDQIKASMGAKFLNFFNSEVGLNLKSLWSNSQKVIETFEVKATKSIIHQ